MVAATPSRHLVPFAPSSVPGIRGPKQFAMMSVNPSSFPPAVSNTRSVRGPTKSV